MLRRITFQPGVLCTQECTTIVVFFFFFLEHPEWQNRKLENLSKDGRGQGFKSGVGNRHSPAGHIDCIPLTIFSEPHLLQICNFCRKNKQFQVANLRSIHAELFFTVKLETFARFLCHKYSTHS